MNAFSKLIYTIKNLSHRLIDGCRAFHNRMLPHPVLYVAMISAFLVFAVEVLSRHSFAETFRFIIFTPHLFVYNCIIVALTLTIAFLFKKQDFMLFLISLVWLGLGITNCCVLMFRITPLGAVDIALITSVLDIFDRYLELWHIILIVAGTLALLVLMVRLWLRSPKHSVRYVRAISAVAVMALVTMAVTQLSLSASAIDDELGNLADAYDDFGFAYCFSASVVDRGINRPDDYSAERIGGIVSALPEEKDAQEYPNIIFVQLESFFDPTYLNGLTLSQDCIPNFRYIKDNYPSGFLTVPSVGAGTANTEFEIITGMRLYDFGTGEYPYKTVLQDACCETVNTYLSSRGLQCHAIHNNAGNFYDRNNVYKALGFDTFTSLEYMDNVTYNQLDWANDSVLTHEVLKALDSTEGRDFVYTVTVQTHGKYPDEPITENAITISGFAASEQTVGFEYFVNQLYETDLFIGELTAALAERDEPTVVVLFGDHLPTFDITEEDLQNGSLYQTEYTIWSNTALDTDRQRQDLMSYKLYSYVLECIGSSGGIISRLHQSDTSPDDLLQIEYDMLYGDNYALGDPVTPTDMRMGVTDITLQIGYTDDEYLYVAGSGFTPHSKITVNGEPENTEYLSSNLLRCEKLPDDGDMICVGQYGSNREALSLTNEIEYSQ